MNLTGIKAKDSYRGILNLAGINQVLDTTLRTVTDGVGNASPLQLSTASVSFGGSTGLNWDNANNRLGIGTNAPSNLLHVIGASRLLNVYIGLAGNNAISNAGADTTININNGVGIAGNSIITPTARLHVRGDGTNPIALFENNAGTLGFRVNNDRSLTLGLGTIEVFNAGPFNFATYTSNLTGAFNINAFGSYNFSSGTNTGRLININYTVNTTGGTNTVTGLLLNATETSITGTTHNLMDLQVGGVSRFRAGRVHDASFGFNDRAAANNWRPLYSISRIGSPTIPALILGVGSGASSGAAYIGSNNDDMYLGTDTSNTFTTNIILKANSVGFVQLGGVTNAFPAIKRNAAAIEFRLADDSAFCGIQASTITGTIFTVSNFLTVGNEGKINGTTSAGLQLSAGTTGDANVKISNSSSTITSLPSAILQVESTTKGFLPPRMTTAQKDAIASPAAGLVVYDTTLNKLCVFTTAWETVTSV
jgi:hypothetical protein